MNDSNKSCAESTKVCFKCGLSKARTDFYGHPRMAKECHMECHKMTTAIKMGNDYAAKLVAYIRSID